ncbi:hypothetical protein IGI39_003325 [Enterococcus sp. AZ135]|uniref:DUF4393 domain-containing protein n=1 Tax=unclassified Enterococcus TaxID=2608891 RepID=UPI003F1FB9A7
MSDEKGSLINIELIPKELITNIFGPATKSLGEGLGGVANFVMGPLRKLNVISEKSYQDFVEKVNCKTDVIPENNRDISKLGLALKVMEDSRYQLENDEMREYFSNLIAGLVDDRKNGLSSPRFSSILAELVSEDASLLKTIYLRYPIATPCVDISIIIKNTSSGIDFVKDLILTNEGTISAPSALNTLESYGLINIDSNELLSQENQNLYEQFENGQEFLETKKLQMEHSKTLDYFIDQEVEIRTLRKHVFISSLGESFCSLVFSPEEE